MCYTTCEGGWSKIVSMISSPFTISWTTHSHALSYITSSLRTKLTNCYKKGVLVTNFYVQFQENTLMLLVLTPLCSQYLHPYALGAHTLGLNSIPILCYTNLMPQKILYTLIEIKPSLYQCFFSSSSIRDNTLVLLRLESLIEYDNFLYQCVIRILFYHHQLNYFILK